jgi:cytochrome c oxidase subunit 1
MPMH